MGEAKATIDSLVKEHFPRCWIIDIPPPDSEELLKDIGKHLKQLNKYFKGEVDVYESSIRYLNDFCSGHVYFKIKVNGETKHMMISERYLPVEDTKHCSIDLMWDDEVKHLIFPLASYTTSIVHLFGVDTFVQEMMPSVPLDMYVKAETMLEEDVKSGIAIGEALADLHNHGLLHDKEGIYNSVSIRRVTDDYSCYFAGLIKTGYLEDDPKEFIKDLRSLFLPRERFTPEQELKYSGMVATILNSYLSHISEENRIEVIKHLKPVFEYKKDDPIKNSPIRDEASHVLASCEKRI